MTNIPAMIEAPEWLDAEAWKEFYNMRMEMWRTKRIPYTRYAQLLILKKLEGFLEWGFDPNVCLKESIQCGYRGVFEKGERNGPRERESFAERNVRRAQEELSDVRRRASEVVREVELDFPESPDGEAPSGRLLGGTGRFGTRAN